MMLGLLGCQKARKVRIDMRHGFYKHFNEWKKDLARRIRQYGDGQYTNNYRKLHGLPMIRVGHLRGSRSVNRNRLLYKED